MDASTTKYSTAKCPADALLLPSRSTVLTWNLPSKPALSSFKTIASPGSRIEISVVPPGAIIFKALSRASPRAVAELNVLPVFFMKIKVLIHY